MFGEKNPKNFYFRIFYVKKNMLILDLQQAACFNEDGKGAGKD